MWRYACRSAPGQPEPGGTVVSLYDGAALVEVAEDDPPGSALDNLLTVAFEELELRWSHRTGWVDGMEA